MLGQCLSVFTAAMRELRAAAVNKRKLSIIIIIIFFFFSNIVSLTKSTLRNHSFLT